MKHIVITLLLGLSLNLAAQDTDPWTRYMTPTETHDLFSEYTGMFNMEITMWMVEGQDPMKASVASKNEMILGGRFLQCDQSGEMEGMSYQAVTTIGFNTISEEITLVTMTNMGTGTISVTGPWNSQTKTATLTGTIPDPVTKDIIKVRQVITVVDADTILIENYDQHGDAPERKSIEYKLVRE